MKRLAQVPLLAAVAILVAGCEDFDDAAQVNSGAVETPTDQARSNPAAPQPPTASSVGTAPTAHPDPSAVRSSPAPSAPRVAPPTGPIMFEPQFMLVDGSVSNLCAGFFTRTDKGEVVSATYTGFVNAGYSDIDRVFWYSLPDRKLLAGSQSSWGLRLPDQPLPRGCLFTPVKASIPEQWVRELDERELPEIDEPVWILYKDDSREFGYELVESKVTSNMAKDLQIELEGEYTMDTLTQSLGSPIISQSSGKVIGMATMRSMWLGKWVIDFAPAGLIRSRLNTATERPLIRDAGNVR